MKDMINANTLLDRLEHIYEAHERCLDPEQLQHHETVMTTIALVRGLVLTMKGGIYHETHD